MPVTIEQFIENLTASGLMSVGEVAAFRAALEPKKKPRDVQALARALVESGKLTKYQAAAVYQGRTRALVLGEYVVLDKLGAGGMGQVFKARHRRMDRLVALKVLPQGRVSSPDAVKRFHREVKAAAKLLHPNIVVAHDAGEHRGIHYLVTEYVDGQDLAQLVKAEGLLPVELAVDYVLQAARGLEHAHRLGIVHRDIKPGNLLVDAEGTVKVLDMGLARMEDALVATDATGSERLTSSEQVMGTCDYMAPEQAEEAHSADHRADVYSLGCTLYRLLTGGPPYGGESLIQVLLAHREKPIPSLRAARRDVPEPLDAVFRKMVAKQPDDRYQSMGEVIAALDACLSGTEPAERRPAEEPSTDSALTSFFKHLSCVTVKTKPHVRPEVDDTITHQSGIEDTGDRLAALPTAPEKSVPAPPPLSPPSMARPAPTVLVTEPGERRKRKRPIPAAVGAGAATIVTLGVALALWRPWEPAGAGPETPAAEGRVITPADGWVDVKGLIDLKRDVVNGTWSVQGDRLVPKTNLGSPREDRPVLALPVDLPAGYEMRMRYNVSNEQYGLSIDFPVGPATPSLVIGGQPAKRDRKPVQHMGLEYAHKHYSSDDNPTHRQLEQYVAVNYTLTLSVEPLGGSRVKVSAKADGGPPLEWTGTAADLAHSHTPLGPPGAITIAAWNARSRIASLEVRATSNTPIEAGK